MASEFRLTSPEIQDGGRLEHRHVFDGFGCDGANRSPALEWSGAPQGTKSYAITCYDPDAPTGSGWWHWVLFDIPASVTRLASGAGESSGAQLPPGAVQTSTDFGKPGYGGPCPPPGHGPHRYIFTVHALQVDRLGVDRSATAALVGFNLHHATLATARLTAHYGR